MHSGFMLFLPVLLLILQLHEFGHIVNAENGPKDELSYLGGMERIKRLGELLHKKFIRKDAAGEKKLENAGKLLQAEKNNKDKSLRYLVAKFAGYDVKHAGENNKRAAQRFTAYIDTMIMEARIGGGYGADETRFRDYEPIFIGLRKIKGVLEKQNPEKAEKFLKEPEPMYKGVSVWGPLYMSDKELDSILKIYLLDKKAGSGERKKNMKKRSKLNKPSASKGYKAVLVRMERIVQFLQDILSSNQENIDEAIGITSEKGKTAKSGSQEGEDNSKNKQEGDGTSAGSKEVGENANASKEGEADDTGGNKNQKEKLEQTNSSKQEEENGIGSIDEGEENSRTKRSKGTVPSNQEGENGNTNKEDGENAKNDEGEIVSNTEGDAKNEEGEIVNGTDENDKTASAGKKGKSKNKVNKGEKGIGTSDKEDKATTIFAKPEEFAELVEKAASDKAQTEFTELPKKKKKNWFFSWFSKANYDDSGENVISPGIMKLYQILSIETKYCPVETEYCTEEDVKAAQPKLADKLLKLIARFYLVIWYTWLHDRTHFWEFAQVYDKLVEVREHYATKDKDGWKEDLKNAKEDLDRRLEQYVNLKNRWGVRKIPGISKQWEWIYASDEFYEKAEAAAVLAKEPYKAVADEKEANDEEDKKGKEEKNHKGGAKEDGGEKGVFHKVFHHVGKLLGWKH